MPPFSRNQFSTTVLPDSIIPEVISISSVSALHVALAMRYHRTASVLLRQATLPIVADLNQHGTRIVISQHPRRTAPLPIDTETYKRRRLIETSSADRGVQANPREARRKTRSGMIN
jgi:hypothetical protein